VAVLSGQLHRIGPGKEVEAQAGMASYTYKKYPYLEEFPDPMTDPRGCQSLEDALDRARSKLHRVWT
jgi:hypothetical protein